MKNLPGNEPGEDFNVRLVHGQLVREKAEPGELPRAAPWWLEHLIYAPLIFWGIWYLFTASGGFRWSEYSEGLVSSKMRLATLQREMEMESPAEDIETTNAAVPLALARAGATLVAEGEKVYASVCIACHQAGGIGLPGAFPPLANSDWVQGDERRLALIVLHGLVGPIEVNGQPWNGVMPPQGATLDDRQIAAVLSYVRSSWGNNASEVSAETVTSLRGQFPDQSPWTQQALTEALP